MMLIDFRLAFRGSLRYRLETFKRMYTACIGMEFHCLSHFI